jgi:hypothetical protein
MAIESSTMFFVKRKAKTAMTMAPWQRIASSSDQVIATLATSAKRQAPRSSWWPPGGNGEF